MSSWQGQRRRSDNVVEHICEHGVGHPDVGSALWQAEGAVLDTTSRPPEGHVLKLWAQLLLHDCCAGMCCGQPGFPGSWTRALLRAHQVMRDQRAMLQGQH